MTESDKLQAAARVLMGQYGNGTDRIQKLTAAGFNASEIQDIVNGLIDGSYAADTVPAEDTTEYLTVDVNLSQYKGVILCLT